MKDYQIIEIVCKVSGVSMKDIVSKSRKQNIVDARYLAFAMFHKYTPINQERVAQLFNTKRTSVMAGVRSVRTALNLYEHAGITSNLTKICIDSKIETLKLQQHEDYYMV